MNQIQAYKQAAKQSKDGKARYVVYVYDQGREVWNGEQVSIYRKMVCIENVLLNGVEIACEQEV